MLDIVHPTLVQNVGCNEIWTSSSVQERSIELISDAFNLIGTDTL